MSTIIFFSWQNLCWKGPSGKGGCSLENEAKAYLQGRDKTSFKPIFLNWNIYTYQGLSNKTNGRSTYYHNIRVLVYWTKGYRYSPFNSLYLFLKTLAYLSTSSSVLPSISVATFFISFRPYFSHAFMKVLKSLRLHDENPYNSPDITKVKQSLMLKFSSLRKYAYLL